VQEGIGKCDAFRKGCDNANGSFIMGLDADLTTPPEQLERFWQAYINGSGECINGTRLVYEMERGAMPFLNFLGNRIFGILFTQLLEQRFTDTLCGLKAISKRNYMNIRKQREFFGDFDPFGDFELIFGTVKNNLKVVEVPVNYKPRKYGKTKTKLLKHGWLLIKMCWVAFKKFKLL
jgi:glycosyltransferase involved in cell wall biosynthesis